MATVGVLALQGSFREHASLLRRLPNVASVAEVRTPEELAGVQGLVIPGGESTTMALVAERWGLIPVLREFQASGRPIWGTCAGMIFLAERAEGTKKGGQPLLGGLDITVSRNFFGAQINSFETQLGAPECLKSYGGDDTFRAVFIRAPAVLQTGSSVEELAHYTLTAEEKATQGGLERVAVAVKSGVLLATAFHPELTADTRWHQLFVDMVLAHAAQPWAASTGTQQQAAKNMEALLGRVPNQPKDLPVFGQRHVALA